MRREHDEEYGDYVAARLERMRSFAFLVCGDWHRAEDAVQTAFVKLYVSWRRASRTSLDAYTRRIVVNCLHDTHRRGWFKRETSTDRVPEPRGVESSDTTDDRLAVLDALSRLPTRRRATVVLRYWEDLSVEETARILGCSTATVKSQSARGLRTLRELLSEPVAEQLEGTTR